MRVEPINNQIFLGIYYSKYSPIPLKDKGGLKLCNISEDKNPPKQLVNIIESSDVLKNIAKDTDIFVSSSIWKKDKSKVAGGIRVDFKDVYSSNKNTITSISIIPVEKMETEQGFWKTCAEKIGQLKDILTMTMDANGKSAYILRTDKDKTSIGSGLPFGFFSQKDV